MSQPMPPTPAAQANPLSVTIWQLRPSSCLPHLVVGLVLGGGVLWFGYSWAPVIGLTVVAVIVGTIGSAGLYHFFFKKKERGTLSFDGMVIRAPSEKVVDLSAPHVAEISADAQQIKVMLGCLDSTGEVELNSLLFMTIKGAAAEQLQDTFPFPGFIKPVEKSSQDMWAAVLDHGDPAHRPIAEAILHGLGVHRQHNIRYKVFAALPWQHTPAPRWPLLEDVIIEADSLQAVAALAAPANAIEPVVQVATTVAEVKLWLNDQIGLTPDTVVVWRKEDILNQTATRSFTLLPLGSGLVARKDAHVSGGGTIGSGGTGYPALVFEGAGLAEPLWVLLGDHWKMQQQYHELNHYFDAAVAFVNRR